MIKRVCDVCGKEMVGNSSLYVGIGDISNRGTTNIGTININDGYEVCHDCEQAIRACIRNRQAKAERE